MFLLIAEEKCANMSMLVNAQLSYIQLVVFGKAEKVNRCKGERVLALSGVAELNKDLLLQQFLFGVGFF